MFGKHSKSAIFGQVTGYASGWNPLSHKAYMVVNVGGETLHVPVDHRQIRFMELEHPVGGTVELDYDQGWHIKSREAPAEFDLVRLLEHVY